MSNFQARTLGMTAFMAANRIDFVIDGPTLEKPARVSAFYDNPDKPLKLQNKQLKILSVETLESGEPAKVVVKFGRETIKLGRRNNASGPVSFYRSLEPHNSSAGPRSATEILDALSAFTK